MCDIFLTHPNIFHIFLKCKNTRDHLQSCIASFRVMCKRHSWHTFCQNKNVTNQINTDLTLTLIGSGDMNKITKYHSFRYNCRGSLIN